MTTNPPDAFAFGLSHYARNETIARVVFRTVNFRQYPLTAEACRLLSQSEEGYVTAGMLSIIEAKLIALDSEEWTASNVATVRRMKELTQLSILSSDERRVELFWVQDLSEEAQSPQDAWLRRELILTNKIGLNDTNLTNIARFFRAYRDTA